MDIPSFKLGIFPDLQITVGNGNVNSLFQINEHEFVASTTKEIVKFEGQEIKMSANYQLECAVYVPPAEMIVCVTYAKHEFLILPVNNFSKPELQGLKTNQFSIYHILYSRESDSIITIGAGIKVWKFEYPKPNGLLSEKKIPCSLMLISQILPNYDSPILHQPVFNYSEELILIPSSQGLQSYRLNGNQGPNFAKISAPKGTVFTLFQKTNKIITIENSDVCVWNKTQSLTHRYNLNFESVIAVFMPNKENAVILNSNQNVILLNLKTGKNKICFTQQQPINRIFFFNNNPYFPSNDFQSIFAFANGPQITFVKASIPWKTWAAGIPKPKLMIRQPKYKEAARILILSENNFIRLFSPKTRTQMTTAASKASMPVLNLFYDREHSLKTSINRDELFVVLSNNSICGFDTLVNPCNENYDNDTYKATALTSFESVVNGVKTVMMAIATSLGDLLICSYDNLEIIQRIQISQAQLPLRHIFYDGNNFLVILQDNEIACVDCSNNTYQVKMRKKLSNPYCIVKMHKNIIYVGDKNGSVDRFEIHEDTNTISERHQPTRQHNAQITSISFSDSFWVTTSLDGDVKLWDYYNTNITNFQFSKPIYSSVVLNGTRDILVGVDGEIMRIPAILSFGSECDKEDEDMDNFDRNYDFLHPESLKLKGQEEKARLEEIKRQQQLEEELRKAKKKPNKKIQAFNMAYEQKQQQEEEIRLLQEQQEKEEQEREHYLKDSEHNAEMRKKMIKNMKEDERQKLLAEMKSFSDSPQKQVQETKEGEKQNVEEEKKKDENQEKKRSSSSSEKTTETKQFSENSKEESLSKSTKHLPNASTSATSSSTNISTQGSQKSITLIHLDDEARQLNSLLNSESSSDHKKSKKKKKPKTPEQEEEPKSILKNKDKENNQDNNETNNSQKKVAIVLNQNTDEQNQTIQNEKESIIEASSSENAKENSSEAEIQEKIEHQEQVVYNKETHENKQEPSTPISEKKKPAPPSTPKSPVAAPVRHPGSPSVGSSPRNRARNQNTENTDQNNNNNNENATENNENMNNDNNNNINNIEGSYNEDANAPTQNQNQIPHRPIFTPPHDSTDDNEENAIQENELNVEHHHHQNVKRPSEQDHQPFKRRSRTLPPITREELLGPDLDEDGNYKPDVEDIHNSNQSIDNNNNNIENDSDNDSDSYLANPNKLGRRVESFDPLLNDPALTGLPHSARGIPNKMNFRSPLRARSPRTESNPFLFDIDKFQARVTSANSDTVMIDPKRNPVRYRNYFFKKDKGSYMSYRSMKTHALPPLIPAKPKKEKANEEEVVEDVEKEITEQMLHSLRPKRSPTPPIIKVKLFDVDLLIPKRAKTPDIEKKTYTITAKSVYVKEMNDLYGRGKNSLEPINIIHLDPDENEINHDIRSNTPRSFQEFQENSSRKRTGRLGDSLIIQPLKVYSDDSQKLSAGISSSRVKIFVPRRGRK